MLLNKFIVSFENIIIFWFAQNAILNIYCVVYINQNHLTFIGSTVGTEGGSFICSTSYFWLSQIHPSFL